MSEHTVQAKKVLDKLIKRCVRENKRQHTEFKEMDYELLLYQLQQNQFGNIVERLKDIDYANPNLLEKLYRYKEKIEELQDIEENEVVKDFKSGKMDPASEVSRFEKNKSHKKNFGRKNPSDEILANLQQQRNLKSGVEFLRFM